jgi:hypothetical protein
MTRVVPARRWLGACALYVCLSALVVASSGAPSTAQQAKKGECKASDGCLETDCYIVSPAPFTYVCYEDHARPYKVCQLNYSFPECPKSEDEITCGRRYIRDGLSCVNGKCTGNLITDQSFTDPEACPPN